MARKKNRVDQSKEARLAQWLDRRSFLMNAGKYSAAAAGLIAGSNTLFSSCMFSDGTDDKEGGDGLPERYKDEAQPAKMDDTNVDNLSAGDEKVYEITIEKAGDYELSISSESSGIEEGTVQMFLLDSEGDVLWSDDAALGASYSEGWTGLQPGVYYLVAQSEGDSVTLIYNIEMVSEGGEAGASGEGGEAGTSGEGGEAGTSGAAGEDGEGGSGEWSDHSEWTDGGWTDAGTWSNNTWSDTSGWKDAGSGTWVAHSDTWYAGEWNDGWQNFGYY